VRLRAALRCSRIRPYVFLPPNALTLLPPETRLSANCGTTPERLPYPGAIRSTGPPWFCGIEAFGRQCGSPRSRDPAIIGTCSAFSDGTSSCGRRDFARRLDGFQVDYVGPWGRATSNSLVLPLRCNCALFCAPTRSQNIVNGRCPASVRMVSRLSRWISR
jgi:hypothetical protein